MATNTNIAALSVRDKVAIWAHSFVQFFETTTCTTCVLFSLLVVRNRRPLLHVDLDVVTVGGRKTSKVMTRGSDSNGKASVQAVLYDAFDILDVTIRRLKDKSRLAELRFARRCLRYGITYFDLS